MDRMASVSTTSHGRNRLLRLFFSVRTTCRDNRGQTAEEEIQAQSLDFTVEHEEHIRYPFFFLVKKQGNVTHHNWQTDVGPQQVV